MIEEDERKKRDKNALFESEFFVKDVAGYTGKPKSTRGLLNLKEVTVTIKKRQSP